MHDQFFVGEYNKKFPNNEMDKENMHLQAKGGVDIPHDGIVSDFIKSGAEVYVVSGKGTTPAKTLKDVEFCSFL